MASPQPPPPPNGTGMAEGGCVGGEGNAVCNFDGGDRHERGPDDRGGQEDGGGCDHPGSAWWPFATGLLVGGCGLDGGRDGRSRGGRRPRPHRRPLPYLSTLAANPRLLGGGHGRSKRRTPGEGEAGCGDDDDEDEEVEVDHDVFSVPLLEEARRRVVAEEQAEESGGPTEAEAAAESSSESGGSRRPQRTAGNSDERVTTEAFGSGDEEQESNLDASPSDGEGGPSGTSADDGPTCPLDDPANSSLTRGQHERYLALRDMHVAGNLSLSSKSTPPAQRKRRRMWRDEFRTLRDLVTEERTRYAEALVDWRGRNVDRFLVGFKVDVDGPASKFVNATSRRVDSWRRRWNARRRGAIATPTRYGRCTQSISLPTPVSGGAGGRGGHRGGVGSHVVALSGGGGGGGGDVGDHYEDDDVVIPDDTDRRNDEDDGLERGKRGVDLNDWVSTLVSTREDVSKGHDDGTRTPKLPVIDGKIATSLRNVPLAELDGDGVDGDSRSSDRGGVAEEESLLSEDKEAVALAIRHGAAVVLPVEAFAALLQRPGGKMSRWKIPLFKVAMDESGTIIPRAGRSGRRGSSLRSSGTVGAKEIVVMEHPVPQPSTPRECLTYGFEGPLYWALSTSQSRSRHACSSEQVHAQYAYSLLSIPSSSSSSGGGPLKVLVRLVNDLQDEEGCPIRRLVQLEYFPERGWELYTPHSRCLWVLEKLLQPTARVLVGRVDPAQAVLLRVEERGVAHALSDRSCDPAQFFATPAVVLRAVTKLRGGSHILCLPGCVGSGMTPTQTVSVSVHDASLDEGDTEATIDIGRELTNAESVFTNRAALLACFRMFEWDEGEQVGRVPHTFPLKKESEDPEDYTGSKRRRT